MATEKSVKAKALQDAAKKNVMLAHKYNPGKHVCEPQNKKQTSIKGWYIFEKIDGIRAVLKDGELVSRAGNKFYAPQEFIDPIIRCFGKLQLDGELVHKDGFQQTVSIVKDQSDKATMAYWKDIRYKIFDYIDDKAPFEYRYRRLHNIRIPFAYIQPLVMLRAVRRDEDILNTLKQITSKGGEGVMLRNPASAYEFGRSHNLLKVKEFQDIEVEIVGHYPGEGKHQGKLGGLVCKLPSGLTFEVGTGFTDLERAVPPTIGSIATIRFFEYTDLGKPRFPVYVTCRDYE